VLTRENTWQALAQLRRSIETELRSLADRREIEVPPRAGAGRLLDVLARAGAVPADVYEPLRYTVQVANAAIHGEDVSLAAAYDALFSAEHALQRLHSPDR
jgi:hypothetical protein